ncbi:DHA2 family efflux MFS transporter permease subunit [Microterricola pindariensis]|uniref:DHA2 family efflux MFS transporter permease subunit n=1 Tax=Microterricola pindariensis TaxID=478010 RepID=UPI001E3DE979|nr:DHA2 family efflux MFS transporter permease subunit [Microterricola pindariensis]
MSDTQTHPTATEPNPKRWLAMAIVSLAVSIIIMDATIVNVILPVLIQDLSLSVSEAEWVNSIYALVFAALLITVGRMGDLFGRRRLLLVGTVIFVGASVLAAASETGTMLLAARLLQGVGGAMILPSTLSTVNAMFTGRERGIAFAIWGSTIGGMAAVGPLLGGWLATDFSWHWAFLINVPIGIIIVVGTILWVPETRDPHATRGVDAAGIALSIVGLAAIVFGLIEGQRYGWWLVASAPVIGDWTWPFALSPVPIAFAIGVVALVGFVLVETAKARAGRFVLLDLGLFRIRSLRYGSIAALIVALGEFGMLFALPLYVQSVLGFTALNTGLLVLALAIGTFLISGGTAQIGRRIGGRGVVRLGLLLEVIAVAGLALSISATANAWALAAWLFLYGIGVGLATAQLTNVILVDVPVAQSGQASGVQSTVRQLGAALGIAILGTVLVTTLAAATAANLENVEGLDAAAQEQVVSVVTGSAGAAIPELASMPGSSAAVQTAASDAMVTAARITTFSAAGVLALGLLATVGLPATPVRRPEEAGAEAEADEPEAQPVAE